MTFKRCVDEEAALKPCDFLWFPVATPITGENRRRQIVIAAREMERKVGQGHSYDLRFSLHASYTSLGV